MTVAIGEGLTLADVAAVAAGADVTFPTSARRRVAAARTVVDDAVASGDVVHGVTTGFGALANVRVDPTKASDLQHGIVRSHATAVGRPLPRDEARAMLLLRAHVLALGHSGVRPELVDLMVAMLNADVIPVVPEQDPSALRRPGPTREPRVAADRGRAGADRDRRRARAEGLRASRARAGAARRQGGPRARERHPGHARDRSARGRAALVARRDRRRDRGDDDRSGPGHGRPLRLSPATSPSPSGAGRERLEPPAAPGGVADPRVTSRQRAPRAGRVLAPLRATGPRGRARRADVRARRARGRAERRVGQPDRAVRRRRYRVGEGTSTVSRSR